MLNRFLSPRLERLDADGGLTTVSEGSTPFLPPVALVDRRLCVFERFATPATGRSAKAAARVYGRTAAPFERSAFVMTPCPGGYGLWWWDADQVDGLLGARFSRGLPATAPETLAQPAGVGWRHVRLQGGYEAQRWEGGRLVASAWRPTAFDDGSWSNFTRTAVEPGEEAPERPPAAQTLPTVASPELIAIGARGGSVENYGQIAAVFAVGLSLGLGAFFGGQAWRLDGLAERAEAETALLAATQPAGDLARLRTQLAQLDSFANLLDRPDPSASLAIAVGVLQLYGVPPLSFGADAERVRIELPYSALGIAPELAGQFAAAGGFRDVRISTTGNRSGVLFEMAPPAPGAAMSLPSGPARSLVTDPSGADAPGASGAAQSDRLSRYEQSALLREMSRTDGARGQAAAPPSQAGTAAPPPAMPSRPAPARVTPPPQPQPQSQPQPRQPEPSREPEPIQGGDIPASVLEAARAAGYKGGRP